MSSALIETMADDRMTGGLPYHRRLFMNCIWRAGDTDGGGDATLRVVGSTMGMALRVRCAIGWCIFGG